MAAEEMQVEETSPGATDPMAEEEEIEEDVTDLEALLDEATTLKDANATIPVLLSIIQNMEKTGPKAAQIKERAVYDLVRAYCLNGNHGLITTFLQDNEAFLSTISKAKTAKLVRQMLDIVCSMEDYVGPEQQEQATRSILDWCLKQKRSFLRQRVEAKLASILYKQKKYAEALRICDALLHELKKLDDKQLLVETHLLESQLHFALRNVPKAKAALTASRTAANSIYVSPRQQAEIDSQSGTIHTEEADYSTAHSYFLEAFEQLDQMNEPSLAVQALKYMMLCKILANLRAALKLSAVLSTTGALATATADSMITAKQAVKYAGLDLDAMLAIAKAAADRNLKQLQVVLEQYPEQLQNDLLIQHHLHILREQLLESNLIRIIEPYSCVQIDFVAAKMEMDVVVTERKLSQMILDGKLSGILDQGKGQLVLYEDDGSSTSGGTNNNTALMEKGLQVLANMDTVVTSLFERSQALRTVMM